MTPAAVLSILVKTQGVAQAQASLNAVNKSAQASSSSLDKSAAASQRASKGYAAAATAAKFGGIAILGVGAAAVKMAGDYQSSMNTLQSVSGATGKQMKDLSKLAVQLGADTKLPGTSAKDAAQAMTEMTKAGLSLGDTMSGVRSVLVLSAAAQISNADAAEIASNALNTFKLKGKDVTMVTDQLANTANASSVEIQDVAEATKMAGAVFAGFQSPVIGAKGALTELNVAIGILGNAGIKGSDAGTSLKQTLLALAAPAQKTKNLMRDLYLQTDGSAEAQRLFQVTVDGSTKKIRDLASNALEKLQGSTKGAGDIAYTAAGKMRTLPQIIDQVSRATKNMTQEQRNAAIATIFGSDATRTVLTLMNAGPKAWDKMTASVTKQGAAQDLAASKMKGFNGAVESLKSSLETLAITFGTKLLPPLTLVVKAVADNLQPAFQALGSFLSANAAPLLTFVGLITALTVATKGWAIAQTAVNMVMEANPYVRAAVLIAVLVAALVKAYQSSDAFRGIVIAVAHVLDSAFNSVVAWVTGIVNFRAVILAVSQAIGTAFRATVAWVAGAVGVIATASQAVVNEVSQWKVLFASIATAWKVISAVWKADLAVLIAVAKVTFAAISAAVKAAVGTLGPIVSAAWGGIKQIFKGALDVLLGLVKVFGGLLKGNFGQVWDGVKQIFNGAWEALKGTVRAGGAALVALVKELPGKFVKALGPLNGLLVAAGKDLIGGLASGIKGALGAITDVAGWLKDQVVAAVKHAFGIHSPSTVFAELGGHMAAGLIKGVLDGNITGFIKDHLGGVKSLAKNLVGKGIISVASLPGKALSALGLGGGGGGSSDNGESSTTGLVAQVTRALAWARAHGWGGTVTSGLRSRQSQQYLWDHASELGLIRGVSVAAPGTSEHERGRAVDVTDIQGFMRAMASAPASAKLIWRGPTDPVHFSVSGHALGTAGATKGLAWVGEQGPELVNFNGGEQVYSHQASMSLAGYASGTVSPSVLAQIKKIQKTNALANPLSSNSAFTTMKGQTGLDAGAVVDQMAEALRAQSALATLTVDTADDIAAAQATVQYAQSAFASALASGNNTSIADTAGNLKTAQDNLKALQDNTDALNDQNALLQAQVDLYKQQALDAQNTANVSQSQYSILAQAIADIANGQIGQRVGVGLSGFRAPAGALSRI